MAIVTICVRETQILNHEIEIQTENGAGKDVAELMNHIEKNGLENIEEYVENVKGIKITETIIEDCPNNDDVSYETWIDDVKGTI